MKRGFLHARTHAGAPELPIAEGKRIEIIRRGRERDILICGVCRILSYGEGEMAFDLGDERVRISGSGLSCTTYISGAIGIRGSVRGIAFEAKEKER